MDQYIVRDGIKIKKSWITVKRGNVFNSFQSNPRNWSYTGTCMRAAGFARCELCDTELVYKHELRHSDTKTSLWIGCECIKWFYQAWMPNGLEKVVLLLKASQDRTHKAHIQEVLMQFKASSPAIYDYLLGANRRYSYSDYVLRYWDIDSFSGLARRKRIETSKLRASLKAKGYLNDNEIETLRSAGITGTRTGFLDKIYKIELDNPVAI